jgi:hypothetical protein
MANSLYLHIANISIHLTKTQQILRVIYPNLTDSTYLPGCVSIMEDFRMMVCCIETIQRKKEACSEDDPAPHDKSVNKGSTTVCVHHKKRDEWNHIFLPQ